MLIIKTITHQTIWGGAKLTPYSNTNNKKIGHLYSLISNDEFESEILNGKYKGQLFKKYFDENKNKFKLSQYKRFPFILALVDADDDLSLQVHPDDKTAKLLENADFGKNESWYFIEVPKTGKIYNGCIAKTKEELKQKIINNKFDEIIDYLDVKKDDYVYVEAGTMHAMSKGSLVYEIEENCNITYRFYDFERKDEQGKKRPLQIEKAINSLDVSLKSLPTPPSIHRREIVKRLYSTKLYKNQSEYKNISDTLECLTIINGTSELDSHKIQRGTTIVLEPKETVELNISDFIIARPITKEEVK